MLLKQRLKHSLRHNLQAFALLEVSIALFILGIITCISMTQLSVLRKIQSDFITKQHIEYVLKALGTYYCYNKNPPLPLPINPNENGFGQVPYNELSIMPKYAKDGYGQWLYYKINDNNHNQKYVREYYKHRQEGMIHFLDPTGTKEIDKKPYVVIYAKCSFNHKCKNNQHLIEEVYRNNFEQIYANGYKPKQYIDGQYYKTFKNKY